MMLVTGTKVDDVGDWHQSKMMLVTGTKVDDVGDWHQSR
ncbi:MAG: hypothetical protein Ta2F_07210 [Termitinemataceae bacterium]|nr:MAG: hypothetical protein Ta2F_07210 [Termitinemataceae bacterium]